MELPALKVGKLRPTPVVRGGITAELYRDIRKDAGAYYKIALEQLYEKPYASYSYYVIGKYYEKSRKMSKAVELYTWSLRLNNFEYRVIYELAVHDIRNKNYKGALERLKMIHNILNKKEVANYLQPKEYTYLFKIYLELENVYGDKFFEIQKYKESVQRRDKLCDMVRNTKRENRAYNEIFGKSAQTFRKETYNHLIDIRMKNR